MASGETLRPANLVAVSVVIVSWNVRDFLLDCMASVLESAGSIPVEIIVVDNASSDGSAEAVEARFPSAVVIRNAGNAGVTRANNQGIRVARGRHILFLNPDTRGLRDPLPVVVRVM